MSIYLKHSNGYWTKEIPNPVLAKERGEPLAWGHLRWITFSSGKILGFFVGESIE